MIGEEEQKRILNKLKTIFSDKDLNLLVLGSVAVHYRLGPVGKTKDIDVRPFPIEDKFDEYWDKLEAITEEINGNLNIETGGSTITLIGRINEKEITVELIDAGGEKFLTKRTIDDMIDTADKIEGLYIPSIEHLVAAKAEAYVDRTEGDISKEKYWEDLLKIREMLKEKDMELERSELERIIDLRSERKREELSKIVNRYLYEVIVNN